MALIKASLLREGIRDFDVYPFSIPAILSMDEIGFSPDVTSIPRPP